MSCNCSNNSSSSSSVQEQISDLQTTLDSLSSVTKFLTCGHPMIALEDPDDISQFNFTTGWGSNCWEGWAIMNGSSYYSPTLKKNITTKNLFDNFIVGAGGSYAVGDTGGSNSVSLTVLELPSHNHTIVDLGHTHNLTDPGHTHGILDPQHNHSGTSDPHSHSLTIDSNEHNHSIPSLTDEISDGGTGAKAWDGTSYGGSGTNIHTHTGIANPVSLTITTGDASTGISVQNAFIGITETDASFVNASIGNTGNNNGHENRPPYVAVLFVKKIY